MLLPNGLYKPSFCDRALRVFKAESDPKLIAKFGQTLINRYNAAVAIINAKLVQGQDPEPALNPNQLQAVRRLHLFPSGKCGPPDCWVNPDYKKRCYDIGATGRAPGTEPTNGNGNGGDDDFDYEQIPSVTYDYPPPEASAGDGFLNTEIIAGLKGWHLLTIAGGGIVFLLLILPGGKK